MWRRKSQARVVQPARRRRRRYGPDRRLPSHINFGRSVAGERNNQKRGAPIPIKENYSFYDPHTQRGQAGSLDKPQDEAERTDPGRDGFLRWLHPAWCAADSNIFTTRGPSGCILTYSAGIRTFRLRGGVNRIIGRVRAARRCSSGGRQTVLRKQNHLSLEQRISGSTSDFCLERADGGVALISIGSRGFWGCEQHGERERVGEGTSGAKNLLGGIGFYSSASVHKSVTGRTGCRHSMAFAGGILKVRVAKASA